MSRPVVDAGDILDRLQALAAENERQAARMKALDEENERLRAALTDVARGPVMPLPDPGAHSWRVFGEAAHREMCKAMRVAKASLGEQKG